MILVFGGIKNSLINHKKDSSKGESFFMIKNSKLLKIRYFYRITDTLTTGFNSLKIKSIMKRRKFIKNTLTVR